jgi:hypothetical protein
MWLRQNCAIITVGLGNTTEGKFLPSMDYSRLVGIPAIEVHRRASVYRNLSTGTLNRIHRLCVSLKIYTKNAPNDTIAFFNACSYALSLPITKRKSDISRTVERPSTS